MTKGRLLYIGNKVLQRKRDEEAEMTSSSCFSVFLFLWELWFTVIYFATQIGKNGKIGTVLALARTVPEFPLIIR